MCVCVFIVNVTLNIPAKLLISRTAKKKDVVNNKNIKSDSNNT